MPSTARASAPELTRIYCSVVGKRRVVHVLAYDDCSMNICGLITVC